MLTGCTSESKMSMVYRKVGNGYAHNAEDSVPFATIVNRFINDVVFLSGLFLLCLAHVLHTLVRVPQINEAQTLIE